MFYRPNNSMRIVETKNASGEISGSTVQRDMEIKEVRVLVSLACAFSSEVIVSVVVVPNNNEEEQHNNEFMIHNEPTISNDYLIYLHETKTNLRQEMII